MERSSFIDQLCVVLVLYKRDFKETPFFSVFNEYDQLSGMSVFVYDNSPSSRPVPDKRITYIHDVANGGVSKAYNEGVKFAIRNNRAWMLFLDQDTVVDLPFFEQLSTVVSTQLLSVAFVPTLRDHQGIVSPFRWSFGKGKRLKTIAGKIPLAKYRFANSGLLINTTAFEKAGGYPENIPLDFSDIAFGERLKKATDHVVVMNSILSHSFSGSSNLSSEEALLRFDSFCKGGFAMGHYVGNVSLYFFRLFLRALKLSARYKNSNFLKIFLKHATDR